MLHGLRHACLPGAVASPSCWRCPRAWHRAISAGERSAAAPAAWRAGERPGTVEACGIRFSCAHEAPVAPVPQLHPCGRGCESHQPCHRGQSGTCQHAILKCYKDTGNSQQHGRAGKTGAYSQLWLLYRWPSGCGPATQLGVPVHSSTSLAVLVGTAMLKCEGLFHFNPSPRMPQQARLLRPAPPWRAHPPVTLAVMPTDRSASTRKMDSPVQLA